MKGLAEDGSFGKLMYRTVNEDGMRFIMRRIELKQNGKLTILRGANVNFLVHQ